MGRPKGSKNKSQKNPFDALSQDWRDAMDALGNDEKALRDQIAKVSLDNAALREAQKEDQDLAEKKAKVASAMESYTPHYKAHKLMVAYLRNRLGDIGKDTGDSGFEESGDASVGVELSIVRPEPATEDPATEDLEDLIRQSLENVKAKIGEPAWAPVK